MSSGKPAPHDIPPDRRLPERNTATGDTDAPLRSSSLLRGRSMVQIEHNGAVYQLRSTRLGKLILTK